MNDYKTLEKRYLNDPAFHRAVTAMYHIIDTLTLTPGELREAVMFAAMQHELYNPKRSIIMRDLGANND